MRLFLPSFSAANDDDASIHSVAAKRFAVSVPDLRPRYWRPFRAHSSDSFLLIAAEVREVSFDWFLAANAALGCISTPAGYTAARVQRNRLLYRLAKLFTAIPSNTRPTC